MLCLFTLWMFIWVFLSRGFHFAIVQDKMNAKQQYNVGGIFCVMPIYTRNEHTVCKFTAYPCKATSCYPASAGVKDVLKVLWYFKLLLREHACFELQSVRSLSASQTQKRECLRRAGFCSFCEGVVLFSPTAVAVNLSQLVVGYF